jgi:glycosyltransferase involved in cell wall biosynthesis
MKLLQVIGTLNPEYGGPVEIITQLSLSLDNLGHRVEIVTLDKKYPLFSNVKHLIIHALGPSLGRYRLNLRLVFWLIKNARKFDVVICNGIWQYQSFAVWLASKIYAFPYFVFIHGALDPWFKKAFPIKHIKKWVYWHLVEHNVLRSARGVLYSSKGEQSSAPKTFKLEKVNGHIVNFGIFPPPDKKKVLKEVFDKEFPGLRGKHILLFLGRIHPKKGCDILIEAFARVIKKDPLMHLVIAGPDETNWTPQLKTMADKYHISNKITWTGMMLGDQKWGALYSAACFLLPSHSENFGVAIVEALACGVPVMITNKVNIWKEIQSEKAGFVGQDTANGFAKLLNQWVDLGEKKQKAMHENAKESYSQIHHA